MAPSHKPHLDKGAADMAPQPGSLITGFVRPSPEHIQNYKEERDAAFEKWNADRAAIHSEPQPNLLVGTSLSGRNEATLASNSGEHLALQVPAPRQPLPLRPSSPPLVLQWDDDSLSSDESRASSPVDSIFSHSSGSSHGISARTPSPSGWEEATFTSEPGVQPVLFAPVSTPSPPPAPVLTYDDYLSSSESRSASPAGSVFSHSSGSRRSPSPAQSEVSSTASDISRTTSYNPTSGMVTYTYDIHGTASDLEDYTVVSSPRPLGPPYYRNWHNVAGNSIGHRCMFLYTTNDNSVAVFLTQRARIICLRLTALSSQDVDMIAAWRNSDDYVRTYPKAPGRHMDYLNYRNYMNIHLVPWLRRITGVPLADIRAWCVQMGYAKWY